MIRQLSSSDNKDIINLLGTDLDLYRFMVDEIQNNEFNSEHLKVYGEFDLHHKLLSFMVNNGDNITYYAKDVREIKAYLSLLSTLSFKKVTCENRLCELFKGAFDFNEDTSAYLAYIKEVKVLRKHMESSFKELTSDSEFGELYDVFMTTEEYAKELPADRNAYILQMKDLIKTNRDKVFGLYIEGRLMSSASIINVNNTSCIVVGVVTHSKFQGKGYGLDVMMEMCDISITEGRILYLFYTNPNARKLYHKIGIDREVGWRVLKR